MKPVLLKRSTKEGFLGLVSYAVFSNGSYECEYHEFVDYDFATNPETWFRKEAHPDDVPIWGFKRDSYLHYAVLPAETDFRYCDCEDDQIFSPICEQAFWICLEQEFTGYE